MEKEKVEVEQTIGKNGELKKVVANGIQVFPNKTIEDKDGIIGKVLMEKLAEIEHQRWADWQRYCHEVYDRNDFGKFKVRWIKQINTPYSSLLEEDKEKDRQQVDRYLPLIESFMYEKMLEKDKEYRKRKNVSDCFGWMRDWLNAYGEKNTIDVDAIMEWILNQPMGC